MELLNKTILLISPEPWSHIFVSKHHYATHLAKRGSKVYFLNPPMDEESCIETEYANLFSVHYKGFIKGLRFLPSMVQKRLIRKKFELLQRLCKVQFDIVWSFDNSVFFDFSALPESVYCISHIVDLNQDFNTEIAAITANLCIGVIPEIVTRLSNYNDNAILIGHGVQEFEINYSLTKLPGQSSIKALYMGNMDMPHIDWSLINNLIKQFPQVDFVFLGSNSESNIAFIHIIEKINAFYIPSVPAKEIPNYLNSADVLLLTYKPVYYSEYASPHKMMEYLGSGKMIVATWTEEYEKLHRNKLLCMSKSANEYMEIFAEVVSNLDTWNSAAKIEARKNFALNNTYDKQIERIQKLMEGD